MACIQIIVHFFTFWCSGRKLKHDFAETYFNFKSVNIHWHWHQSKPVTSDNLSRVWWWTSLIVPQWNLLRFNSFWLVEDQPNHNISPCYCFHYIIASILFSILISIYFFMMNHKFSIGLISSEFRGRSINLVLLKLFYLARCPLIRFQNMKELIILMLLCCDLHQCKKISCPKTYNISLHLSWHYHQFFIISSFY